MIVKEEDESVFQETQQLPRGAGGNGKGKRKWPNLQNIAKLIASMVGLGGVYLTYLEFSREVVTVTIRLTAKAITNSHESISPKCNYLPRKDIVEKIKKAIGPKSSDDYMPTIIVYGPRGSGKSTAVQIAVNQEKRPVLLVRITAADMKDGSFRDLAFKIIDSAIQKAATKATSVSIPKRVHSSSILTGALRQVKQLPIIILEVDVKFPPEELQQLLVQLKSWGDDSRLAQFILVLSSANTALGLTISASNLRTRYLFVDDLNEEEVKEFLRSKFPNISESTIQHVHTRVGNRILHLKEVASGIKEADIKEPTDSDLMKFSDEYAKEADKENFAGLNLFLENCKTIPPPSLFEAVLQGQVNLKEFSKAFGMTMKKMIEIFLQPPPHPFYVHPRTLMVTVGSHFMEKAIYKRFALEDDLQATK